MFIIPWKRNFDSRKRRAQSRNFLLRWSEFLIHKDTSLLTKDDPKSYAEILMKPLYLDKKNIHEHPYSQLDVQVFSRLSWLRFFINF